MAKTIEQKAAETILQKPDEIKAGDKTYTIAPPSLATLILVSEDVARLPHVHLNEKKVIEETLSVAKDCRAIGDIAATLILGARQVNEKTTTRRTVRRRRLWGLFHTSHTEEIIETKKEQLSRELLEQASPRDLHNLVAQTLLKMQVGDFFGLTTFLTEINLMRPTKVETEAIASGL